MSLSVRFHSPPIIILDSVPSADCCKLPLIIFFIHSIAWHYFYRTPSLLLYLRFKVSSSVFFWSFFIKYSSHSLEAFRSTCMLCSYGANNATLQPNTIPGAVLRIIVHSHKRESFFLFLLLCLLVRFFLSRYCSLSFGRNRKRRNNKNVLCLHSDVCLVANLLGSQLNVLHCCNIRNIGYFVAVCAVTMPPFPFRRYPQTTFLDPPPPDTFTESQSQFAPSLPTVSSLLLLLPLSTNMLFVFSIQSQFIVVLLS